MERYSLYVGVPELWRHYELCRTLELSTCPMFAYFEKEIVDGGRPNSSRTRGHLYRMLAQTIVLGF